MLRPQPPRMEGPAPSLASPRAPSHQLAMLDPHLSPSLLGLRERGPTAYRNEDLSLWKLRVLRFLIGLSESLVLKSLQPVVVTN